MRTHADRDELLTVKELAAEWRQHPATIYRKIAEGEIPAVRLGAETSALRIPRTELERLSSTLRNKSPEPETRQLLVIDPEPTACTGSTESWSLAPAGMPE